MEKKFVLACDHAGYPLKEELKEIFTKEGYEVIDCGTDSLASVDYPAYATKLCETITRKEAKLGILVCGTGIGMSMAANKHAGIRAACCSDTFSARMTRMHNDANVLCMGYAGKLRFAFPFLKQPFKSPPLLVPAIWLVCHNKPQQFHQLLLLWYHNLHQSKLHFLLCLQSLLTLKMQLLLVEQILDNFQHEHMNL